MRLGTDLSCGRIRHANRSRSPRRFLRQSFRPPQPPGERSRLIGSSGKPGPALSHSRVQLPYFDNLPKPSVRRSKIAYLFSYAYKSLFPQMFSFYILTKRRGVYPLKWQFSLPGKARSILFHTLARSFARFQLLTLFLSTICALSRKNTRVAGVPSRTSCI